MTGQKERVWAALQKAAERIGHAEYAAGRYRGTYRRGKLVRGYSITEAHKAVLDAMNALGRDEITPEEAMAVLHEHDVLKARTQPATKRKTTRGGRLTIGKVHCEICGDKMPAKDYGAHMDAHAVAPMDDRW